MSETKYWSWWLKPITWCNGLQSHDDRRAALPFLWFREVGRNLTEVKKKKKNQSVSVPFYIDNFEIIRHWTMY